MTGTNFSGAKAGIQPFWATVLVIGLWILAGISGIFSGFASSFVLFIFNNSPRLPEHSRAGWVSLIMLVVLFFVILRKGLVAVTILGALAGALVFAVAVAEDGVIAVAVAVTVAVAVAVIVVFAVTVPRALAFAVVLAGVFAILGALAGAGVFNFAGAFSVVFAVAFALAFAVVFAFIVAVAETWAGAVAIVLAGAFAFVGVFAVALVIALAEAFSGPFNVAITAAFAVAFTLVLLCAYIGWRAIQGDEKNAWIRGGAIAFAATGGTSFRHADLTDADFTKAILKSTDLRQATLTRTRFHQTKKLDQIRPGITYLNCSGATIT
ncbi:MAG: pentapeptide repeat-containing protein, partial [Coleofasciculus sp. C2-GNP5-27]